MTPDKEPRLVDKVCTFDRDTQSTSGGSKGMEE